MGLYLHLLAVPGNIVVKLHFAQLTHCQLGDFACYFVLPSTDSLKIYFFEKFFQEYQRCRTVRIQIRPDVLSGLIWVQTVFKADEPRR